MTADLKSTGSLEVLYHVATGTQFKIAMALRLEMISSPDDHPAETVSFSRVYLSGTPSGVTLPSSITFMLSAQRQQSAKKLNCVQTKLSSLCCSGAQYAAQLLASPLIQPK